jgi:glycosyltransferase involved in cell wall biosynthesis
LSARASTGPLNKPQNTRERQEAGLMISNSRPKVYQVFGGTSAGGLGVGWGGGLWVVLPFARKLTELGCQVWVLCFGDFARQCFSEIGAKTVFSPFWRRAISPRMDLLAFWELFRLCRRERFDVVHTHTSKGGFLGRIAARLAGVPLVIHTAHGFYFNQMDCGPKEAVFYRFLEKFASHFCDLVISVNEEDRLSAIQKKVVRPSKIYTVINGINTKKFENAVPPDSLRAELDPSGQGILIGTTGRLMPQKGYHYLVQAMPSILRGFPQVRLVFVGDGPLESELKGLAAQLGVSDQCRFLGFRTDITELLACFDMFVLPSLWEGLSISLLEALAAGKPIVATNIKGNREVIDHGVNGLLVNPGDPAALAEGIIHLLRDKEKARAMGERAKEKAKAFFSEEAMVRRTLDLYRSKQPSLPLG